MSFLKAAFRGTVFYELLKKLVFWIRYIFSPCGIIRNYIFFPLFGKYRVSRLGRKFGRYKYIEKYKNLHLGERCFVLATGPSLRIEDVEKLKNETTIAVNSFYKMYDRTAFRPDYYIVLDPDAQKQVLKNSPYDLNEVAKDTLFFNSIKKIRNKNIKYLHICYQNHWFNIYNSKFEYGKNLKFSSDLLYGLYDKYTITNSAIELAIYMGCKEIYLLGVDCNYSGPNIYSFKQEKDSLKPSEFQAACTQKAMMTGYKFIEIESQKRGVKIYNATRGGNLEEFERVNLDEVI